MNCKLCKHVVQASKLCSCCSTGLMQARTPDRSLVGAAYHVHPAPGSRFMCLARCERFTPGLQQYQSGSLNPYKGWRRTGLACKLPQDRGGRIPRFLVGSLQAGVHQRMPRRTIHQLRALWPHHASAADRALACPAPRASCLPERIAFVFPLSLPRPRHLGQFGISSLRGPTALSLD